MKKLVGLDLFRVYAAFVVFLFHAHTQFKCDYKIFNSFISMGAMFMTAFFVLSGFVLYYVYGGQSFITGKDYAKFYLKRISCILPIYYFQGLLHILVRPNKNLLDEIKLFPVEILGVQTWYSSLFHFSHNGGSWFISCILFAYFLFPLISQFPRFMSNKGIIVLEIIMGAVLLYSPFVEYFFRTSWIYDNLLLRCCEFMLGILLCEQFKRNEVKQNKTKQNKTKQNKTYNIVTSYYITN